MSNTGSPPPSANSLSDGQTAGGPLTSISQKTYTRTYVACVNCRSRKVKCIIGARPPCAKCQREHRECVFDDQKRSQKRRKPPVWAEAPSTLDGESERPSKEDTPRLPISSSNTNQASSLPLSSPGAIRTRQNEASVSRQPGRPLTDKVIRGVVTKPGDALNLLFDASRPMDQDSTFSQTGHGLQHFDAPGSTPGLTPAVSILSYPTDEVMDVWDKCRFVRQGWFTSQEAVTYIDLFFKNMAHWSPILPELYRFHHNHHRLIAEEPVLCTTILMISSRYHTLPGVGGKSRGYHIHHRLWHHCEHLINRIVLGQEKYSTAKTRTLGSIEALLLISEWHPRAILFPPETDGWDAQLLSTDIDARHRSVAQDDSPPVRWREDVFLPTSRSESMSWMLASTALSLAYELGVFTEDGTSTSQSNNATTSQHSRIRKLLYVYVNQISARLGCPSMLPQNISYLASDTFTPSSGIPPEYNWVTFMEHWMDITRLMKTAFDMFFASATFTKQLLLSGRYIPLLQHFSPSLERWHENFSKFTDFSKPFEDILFIEYHYIKAYTNSLAIQAVVERALSRGADRFGGEQDDLLSRSVDPQDYKLINEVVTSSRQILQKGIALVRSGNLKFMPMRVLLRITSASLFLLKAISIGGPSADLQISLKILDESDAALRATPIDDMDLASRYATLIERHVTRFRHNFTISRQPDFPQGFSTGVPGFSGGGDSSCIEDSSAQAQFGVSQSFDTQMFAGFEDWSTQPFDPSLAPFSTNGNQISVGFDAGSLDFLWNIPDWEV
ncbi:C6 transcription factor [Leptodontidium sp. 2 PMI_412]|nr:C6 transcription factor [Leptodontidium sp. 2 PMI_412]